MASTTDREALLALYGSTDGPNWKNKEGWNTDAEISKWHGVEVDNQGRVVQLSLSNNNLRGPIPAALEALTELRELHLNDNKLTGPVPTELGNLGELRELSLHKNRLTGAIPPALGALNRLDNISFFKNLLIGPVPEALEDCLDIRESLPGGINFTGNGQPRSRDEMDLEIPPYKPGLARGRPAVPRRRVQFAGTRRSSSRDLTAEKKNRDGLREMIDKFRNEESESSSSSNLAPPPRRSRRPREGGLRQPTHNADKNSEENWQNRLEPYNNISVISTLLAGFGLSIFPLPRSDVPESNDLTLGLAGHLVYNFLMCCSFSANVLVTVILTLQLYFTQRLATLPATAPEEFATAPEEFMACTQDIRHFAVSIFFCVSLPAFMVAFTMLLLTVLEDAAAICTAVVPAVGVVLVVGSTTYYFSKFKSTIEKIHKLSRELSESPATSSTEGWGTLATTRRQTTSDFSRIFSSNPGSVRL